MKFDPDVQAPANVVEALLAVMGALPAIGKDQKASQAQGGYAYRGIENITREAQGLFAKYGVVFAPRVLDHEIRDVVVNGKPWTDTYARVEYTVYGPGGVEDKIVVGPILAIGRDNSDKGGNKCLTQAFKYALIQTLCISDSKDDADHGSPEADAEPEPDPEADALRRGITEAVAAGVITGEAAQKAASAHGVGTAALLARAPLSVMQSLVQTLGFTLHPAKEEAPSDPA